jgi:hypothetical protein
MGALLMLWALVNSSVTLATQDYRAVLIMALGSAVAALCFLAVPFIRGPATWRITALLLASPALFVASDFLRRAPHVFVD